MAEGRLRALGQQLSPSAPPDAPTPTAAAAATHLGGAWATASAPDRDEIKRWFDTWGAHVAAKEFDPARELFGEEALGFGTWMDFVQGREELINRQWRSVWPTIKDFHHRTEDALEVTVSPDRLMAVGLVLWTSTGFEEDGTEFERPGRTTAVFTRASTQQEFRCE